MPTFKVLRDGYGRPNGEAFSRIIKAGEEVDFDVKPGTWLEPLNGEEATPAAATPREPSTADLKAATARARRKKDAAE